MKRIRPARGRCGISNPRKQRGWAPIYAFHPRLLLLLGLLVLGAALLVATLLFQVLSALQFEFIAMWIAAAAVATYSAYVYIAKIALPQRRRHAYLRREAGVQAIRRLECNALPGRILTRSLLVDAAAIRMSEIIQLLSERGLEFIEVKPYLQVGKPPQIAMRDERGPWQFPALASAYVRLRLSSTLDPQCKPEQDWREVFKGPPFLPDTCLTAEPVEQATAELMMVLEPAPKYALKPYGAFKLVRRQTQEVLAQLSTAVTVGQSLYGSGESLSDPSCEVPQSDCRFPRIILASLLFSPDAVEPKRSVGVLKLERSTLRVSWDQILAQVESLPLIQAARETHAFLSEQERLRTFSPTLRSEGWSQSVAIAHAAETQIASYGGQLLDLGGHRLIQLQHDGPNPWNVHAVLNGFFLTVDRQAWDTSPRNLLVRVRADGEFEWAVAIAPPAVRSIEAMRWPGALFAEDGSLVIAQHGREVAPEDRPSPGAMFCSPRWEVPLASLPPIAPLARSQ